MSPSAAAAGAVRLPRLLALVPYLMSRPASPLPAVAAVFGITEKQLRADLDLLFLCGLPGHSPGDLIDVSYSGDTVTLTNAETIARPLRLTPDEATALLVAVRALADLPGLSERDALDRALVKLEVAAGASAAAAEGVAVALDDPQQALETARAALSAGRVLRLSYHVPGRDEDTERDVDPLKVVLTEGRWYLEAWCRRVEAVRLFRLDRVVGCEVLEEPSAPPPGSGRPHDGGLFLPSVDDVVVILDLDPAARWIADYYPCESVVERSDGTTRVVLRAATLGWVRRLLLRQGGSARAVTPATLAQDVAQEAERALARYHPNG